MNGSLPLIANIYGTAFAIGDRRTFLTAAHVVTAASSHTRWGICTQGNAPGTMRVTPIDEFEVFSDLDLAVFVCEADLPIADPLPWVADKAGIGSSVLAFGYPYGWEPSIDGSNDMIISRVLQGHIVTRGRYPLLSSAEFIYEVSFMSPRGLSGGPLSTPTPPFAIAGVMLANKSIQMEVFRSREEVRESSHTTEYVTVEAVHFGIALPCCVALEVEFQLLNGTLKHYLSDKDLLVNAAELSWWPIYGIRDAPGPDRGEGAR